MPVLYCHTPNAVLKQECGRDVFCAVPPSRLYLAANAGAGISILLCLIDNAHHFFIDDIIKFSFEIAWRDIDTMF